MSMLYIKEKVLQLKVKNTVKTTRTRVSRVTTQTVDFFRKLSIYPNVAL